MVYCIFCVACPLFAIIIDVFGIHFIVVCFYFCLCSAFSDYNMDQFTPAKVDRDQVRLCV